MKVGIPVITPEKKEQLKKLVEQFFEVNPARRCSRFPYRQSSHFAPYFLRLKKQHFFENNCQKGSNILHILDVKHEHSPFDFIRLKYN